MFRFKKKKPNVIMIMIDGLRADALEDTPFYRELKKEGVFFSHLITYAPYTIGSLHALFSGMRGKENGVDGYYNSCNFDTAGCYTLAQYLKDQGYHTESDLINESILPRQGFDMVHVHDEFKDDLARRHGELLLRMKDKEPFFLFLDYSKLHTHLVNNVIKKYSDFDTTFFTNKKKNYAAYLKKVGESADYLKAIKAKVRELGLDKDSIIILFTDHGGSAGDKPGEKAYGVYLHDYTLRCFLYLIGGDFPEGRQYDHPISSIDVLPTLLEYLGIKKKEGFKPIKGRSFLGFLKGKTEERTTYSETGGLGGPTPSPEKHNIKCVRTSSWKLILNETTGKVELYSLVDDPQESKNLSGKGLAIENTLREQLRKIDG